MKTLFALCICLSLSGCAFSPRQRVVSLAMPGGGQRTITQDMDWSTSGNLAMYYDDHAAALSADTSVKNAKAEGIAEAIKEIAKLSGMESNAKAFAIMALADKIDRIPNEQPRAMSAPPRTAVSLALGEGGLVSRLAESLVSGAVNKWVFGSDVLPYGANEGSGGGDTTVFDHVNIGGDFASKAVINKDKNPTIAEGASYQPSEAGPTFDTSTSDSHDTDSRNTDSPAVEDLSGI